MLECPRCGNEAEYLAGEVFVLVWCGFCDDVLEVGDLELHTVAAAFAEPHGDGQLTAMRSSEEAAPQGQLAPTRGA
jgi:hypothetical protein